MKLSFIIPCYRSEHTLEAVIAELESTMLTRPEYDYEVILTDDCSPDNVWSVIEKLAMNNSRIKAQQFTRNFGQHAALLAGLSLMAGDAAFFLDDDGQAPLDELFKLVEELEKGYDVVYGSYPEIKQNLFRRFGSWMNKKMAEVLLDWPKDVQATSFFVCRRLIVDEILKYDKPYPYIDGLIARATKKIGHVQVQHRERAYGSSGYTFAKLLKLWINGFTAFSVKPLRMASLCGAGLAFIGFAYLIFIIVVKFTDPTVVAGYSSIMATLLLKVGFKEWLLLAL